MNVSPKVKGASRRWPWFEQTSLRKPGKKGLARKKENEIDRKTQRKRKFSARVQLRVVAKKKKR